MIPDTQSYEYEAHGGADEEIDEDEAFDSGDEEKYGDFFRVGISIFISTGRNMSRVRLLNRALGTMAKMMRSMKILTSIKYSALQHPNKKTTRSPTTSAKISNRLCAGHAKKRTKTPDSKRRKKASSPFRKEAAAGAMALTRKVCPLRTSSRNCRRRRAAEN